jgi:multisubunit Na+/H+ antiporter MnhG subunit
MRNKSSKFWGLVLVVVGIMFLGNNLDWWNVNLFFRGWWTLFIIIPSIYGLFDNTDKTGSSISLIVGILLLLAAQDIISYGMIWKILFPIIIIIVGLSLICKTNLKRKMRENSKEYVAVFSGVDEKIKEVVSDFKAISIFGSVELDLRKAKIEKDLYIEAVTVFGGIDLKLPENVKVQTSGVPIFGGVENKCLDNKEGVVVTIHYTCVFGGIDIF